MTLQSLVPCNATGLSAVDRSAMIARYQQLRAAGLNLNNKLVECLTKDVLHEGGRRLGILKGGTFYFDSEDETAVLMDFCIYDVRRNGCNCFERYLADSPPDSESDEMAYLRAMQRGTFSLYVVETVERGLGVTVQDLRSGETMLLVDMGLGSTAEPGLVLATRILRHDDFAITSGAGQQLGVVPKGEGRALVQCLAELMGPDEQGYCDPAPLIAACLKEGRSSQVQHELPTGNSMGQRLPLTTPATTGRNSPCPCGSGRKFKHCCLKRT